MTAARFLLDASARQRVNMRHANLQEEATSGLGETFVKSEERDFFVQTVME